MAKIKDFILTLENKDDGSAVQIHQGELVKIESDHDEITGTFYEMQCLDPQTDLWEMTINRNPLKTPQGGFFDIANKDLYRLCIEDIEHIEPFIQ